MRLQNFDRITSYPYGASEKKWKSMQNRTIM